MIVELLLYDINLFVRKILEVDSSREILPDESIEILDPSFLPRRIGIGEVSNDSILVDKLGMENIF